MLPQLKFRELNFNNEHACSRNVPRLLLSSLMFHTHVMPGPSTVEYIDDTPMLIEIKSHLSHAVDEVVDVKCKKKNIYKE